MRSVAWRLRTAVRSCHSSGKTYTLAQILLWWLVRWPDAIAVTTAPTDRQVEKLLWGEIHKAIARCPYPLFPDANLTELRIGPGNYAIGFATDKRGQGVRFQGFHSGHLLVILDEAQGVSPEVWEAVEGVAASGDVRIVAISNPIIPGGPFYEAFTSDRERWKTITISAFETPNFKDFTLEQLRQLPRGLSENDPVFTDQPRPYLLGRRWVYDAFWKYGEESPFWQSRVLGDFPEQAEDALISLRWLEAARTRAVSSSDGPLRAGVDVAGPGEDETVAVIRDSLGAIVALQAWGQPDPRGEVVSFLAPYKGRLESVNVDSAGIGYYFGRHLSDLGYPVNLVNVGAATSSPAKFANLKAQLYWALRERFEEGQVAGLKDEVTVSQLASVRYEHNARGQVVIESKEDARKRGVKSPDRAEAVMLAFAADRLEWLRAYARRIGEWRRDAAEAEAQGKPAPPGPYDGKAIMDSYQRSAAEFRKLAGLDEAEEPSNQRRILPSIVNYVTRRPA
jgi:phage terminase large subunit